MQVQVQGPLPLTVLVDPAAQRLLAGFDVKMPPSDVPHVPLINRLAEQAAVLVEPVQFQVQKVPLLIGVVAVPALQRLVEGTEVK